MLNLGMGHHHGPDHRHHGPIGPHPRVQHRIVVEDAAAMDSAVINLVLEESEEKMVSQPARARRWLRARDDEEAILGRRERGVELEPEGSLLIPVDHGLVDCVCDCVVVVERCLV